MNVPKKKIILGILGIFFVLIFSLYFASEPIAKKVLKGRVDGIIKNYPQLKDTVTSVCMTVKFSRQCKAHIETDLKALPDEESIKLVKSLTSELESEGWGIYKINPGESVAGDITATQYYRNGDNKKGCSFLVNTKSSDSTLFVRIECVASGFPRQMILIDLF